jgi:hypothetical protein
MTATTGASDTDFEADVRAMLTRRAADVSPSPAPRRHRATAPGPGHAPAARQASRVAARPTRVLLVAAALVLLVGAAAVAVRSTGPGDGDTTVAGDSDGQGAYPVPGTEGWDPATAPPVWPVIGEEAPQVIVGHPRARAGDLATPEGAAAAYLAELASPLVLDPAGLTVTDDDGPPTAEIPWSFTDGSEPGARPFATGSVHLRDVAEAAGAAAPVWAVVGASTDIVTIEDVRLDGGRLTFTAVVVPPADTSVSIRVGVDGTFVTAGGAPLPQGGPADPSSGELMHLTGGRGEVALDVEPGTSVDVLVRSVGGDFLSVTHMAIDVPVPADPATAAPDTDEPATDDADDSGEANDTAATAGDVLPTPVEPLDGTGELALFAGQGSATEVARAYLDARLPENPDEPVLDDGRRTMGTIPGGGATEVIPWRLKPPPSGVVSDDNPPISDRYSGEVRLQAIEGGWAVVAATTDQIALREVHRDDETVTLTVDRLDDAAIDLLDLAVFDVDGHPVGEAASAPLGSPGTWTVDLGGDVDPDAALTLRARHMGGGVFSLTEVRVPPADAGAVSPP